MCNDLLEERKSRILLKVIICFFVLLSNRRIQERGKKSIESGMHYCFACINRNGSVL
jgi:hypothetical protein